MAAASIFSSPAQKRKTTNPMKHLLPLFLATSTAYAASVTLTWDPNPEADLAGYRIYYGPSTRNYTNALSFPGRGNTNSVTNLTAGTYYFAVTAYSTNNLESDYSNEVAITVPGRPPAPTNLRGEFAKPLLQVEWRGKTNSNGTVTPTGRVLVADGYGNPVTVAATLLTNGVAMVNRNVTTTNGVVDITANRAILRPMEVTLDVTRLTFDPEFTQTTTYSR